ncbi:hypothetical protein BGZ63DRAFT_367918 [Mariannaea sp. PMI_226]|nr:hypothetical protein BGZ63DRAFT_367918 [Mariannaea sp. PMI_226]
MRRISRSRGGCARCKSQHMKCDEQRPACGRCVRAKAQCPGYQKAIRWSTKHEFISEAPCKTPAQQQQQTQLPSPAKSSVVPAKPRSLLSMTEEDMSSFAGDVISEENNHIGHGDLNVSDWLGELASFGFARPASPLTSSASRQQPIAPGEDPQQTPPSPAWLRPPIQSPLEPKPEPRFHDASSALLTLGITRTQNPDGQGQATEVPDSTTLVPPLVPGLTDTATLLSDFYFQETAGVFSVYDGGMNPFRSLVSRLWTQSRVIFSAMQSMAATGLESVYPFLGPIGKQHRQDTVDILMSNEDCDETSLLALLMIGASSSWHDPTESGVALFNSFQNRMQRAVAREYFLENSNNYRFFHESLVYWQMLLSFVVDDFKMGSYQILGPVQGPSMEMQAPHPWTGVGHEVQRTLCDIGRLVRSQRQQARLPVTITQGHVDRLQNSIIKAFELEGRLLQLSLPPADRIISPDDSKTTVQHLLTLAQVYRLVGLLQIYRIFPDILWQRLQSSTMKIDAGIRPLFELVCRHVSPWENARGYYATQNTARQDLGSWLTMFALNILNLFQQMPVESGTRAFQPFLLVACGSELRVPPKSRNPGLDFGFTSQGKCPELNSNPDFVPEMSLRAVEVLRARGMVMGRLETLSHLLPPKPHEQCMFVVKETWRKMDALGSAAPGEELPVGSQDSVFWMDIMIENGWETIMG